MIVTSMPLPDSAKDRFLAGLICILMSAIVFAEQNESPLTYDELTRNTIYGSAGRWRSEPTTAKEEWRAPTIQEQMYWIEPTGGSILADQNKFKEDSVDNLDFDSTTSGYRLFKIDI